MISLARAREVLAAEGVELSDEKLAMLVEDVYAVSRVLVSSFRADCAQKRPQANTSGFSSAEDGH